MCNDTDQHAAMEQLVEGSGHFRSTELLYYMGWFNKTHEPNPELLEECTVLHKLVTLASDQSDNLSFLNKLPPNARLKQPAMWQGGQPKVFSPDKAYVALLMSDGDNIAEDWATLRPMLEVRVASGSKVPV